MVKEAIYGGFMLFKKNNHKYTLPHLIIMLFIDTFSKFRLDLANLLINLAKQRKGCLSLGWVKTS